MGWGIQVNVGTRPEPNWQWMYDADMRRIAFQTKEEAQVRMAAHWGSCKCGCFRVANIDEE